MILERMILLASLIIGPAWVRADEISFLDYQAGIAAYFQFSPPTNLQSNLLRNLFRTIEADQPDYLIGSVPATGYEGNTYEDVKVFIHSSGWVVAYYLRDAPASKALDKSLATTTRLESVLASIAYAIDAVPTIAYTHFQYPQASRLIRIGRMRGSYGVNTFEVSLPVIGTLYERSWSLSSSIYNVAYLHLDNRQIGQASGYSYGAIHARDMVAGAKHLLELQNGLSSSGAVYAELVVVYAGTGNFSINYADMTQIIPLTSAPAGLKAAAMVIPYYRFYLPDVAR